MGIVLISCRNSFNICFGFQWPQSSGPLRAHWRSGLVSSATEKFSFSSGAHDLVCARRFCLWYKNYKNPDKSMVKKSSVHNLILLRIRALHLLSPSVLVTASSCDHSIKVWGLDTDRLIFWIFQVLFYGDLWVTAALLIGAVVLKVSQIIPWLVNSSPSYGEVDTMIDGTRKQCNNCAIFFLSSFWHLSYSGCLQ